MKRASLAILLLFAAQVAPAQTTHVVTVNSGTTSFSPPTLTIVEGDSVRWVGLQGGGGVIPHNVVEVGQSAWNGNQDIPNGGFSSGPASAGTPEFTQLFSTAGSFFYICQPHISMSMKGQITVNAAATPTPSPSPTPIPALVPIGLVAMIALLLGAGIFFIFKGRMTG